MNRPALVLAAIVVLAMGIAVIILGQNLILPHSAMIERGAGMAWYITWAMVWITTLCALALSGFLLKSTARKR